MSNKSQDELRFTRTVAVQLANISLELLERCETERLIEVHTIQEDELVYSVSDVRQLARISRLHEVLGIAVEDMDVVLHLRNQLIELHEQLQEIEQQSIAREEMLMSELIEIRKLLAEEVDWK